VIWFTSDLHFFHKNVIGFCNRPWTSVEEMNEGLIKNWNDRVRKTEQVYVLGDFLFGGSSRLREIVPRLNGQKTLVRGNHDATARKVIAAGFHDVVENEAIKLPNGTKVLLSHFPYYPDPAEEARAGKAAAGIQLDTRYLHKRILRDDYDRWLLHGHVHTQWQVLDKQINVGVDVWNWRPVPHETIQAIIEAEKP
jgi:calcineurin-like phosphoesterase family protein